MTPETNTDTAGLAWAVQQYREALAIAYAERAELKKEAARLRSELEARDAE